MGAKNVSSVVVRDVVIVVPGIMGSELVGRDGKALWTVAPGGLAAAIRALAAGKLALPAGIGDEAAGDGVRATRLLDSLHVVPGLWSPVTGYDGLLRFLDVPNFAFTKAKPEDDSVVPNLIRFPYDWRLSSRHNGRRLACVALKALERWQSLPGNKDAKLVLLCHSLGGLVARWFAEQEGGAEHIRAMVTMGTPFRGAPKALSAIVNGLAERFGPLHVPLSDFARSLPSLYQLLPQYDCIVDGDRRIGLAAAGCPGLCAAMLADANAFHAAIDPQEERPYRLHKLVGIRQPTAITARVAGGRVELFDSIDGTFQDGDGTVPMLAATPFASREQEMHYVAGQHGELQGTRSLHDLVDGILTGRENVWLSPPKEGLGVAMDDVWSTADEPTLQVHGMSDHRLHLNVFDEAGRVVGEPRQVPADGRVTLAALPEGGYRAEVEGGVVAPDPISKPFVVLAAI